MLNTRLHNPENTRLVVQTCMENDTGCDCQLKIAAIRGFNWRCAVPQADASPCVLGDVAMVVIMGQADSVGPAGKRYWRTSWIAIIASILIGALIARPLGLSPFVTMGVIAVLLLLVTLSLALAARRERLEQDKFEHDGG